jgi:hypothetical protein
VKITKKAARKPVKSCPSFRDQAVTQFASGENENLPAQKRAATTTAGDNDGFVEAFPSRYFGPEGHAGVYFLC